MYSYLLVDGIYPEWTCFLGPISHPKTASEKHYTTIQESRRKDIERAFGALQNKWHILNKPSLTPDVTLMNRILRVCVILHNMVQEPQCMQRFTSTDYYHVSQFVQVVEEKRQCHDCTSIADAVEKDAQEVDRELMPAGELERLKLKHSSFDDSSAYLRHLADAVSHKVLMVKTQAHLWMKKKNDEAQARYRLYAPLFE